MKLKNSKKLVALRITITYDGVGFTKEQALGDIWNTISNDTNFTNALINYEDVKIEDTNFDADYLKSLMEDFEIGEE
jgi:hypothetical protein